MIAIIFIFAIIVSSVIWLKTIARYHCTYNCKLCTFYVLFVVFYISIYCAYLNEFLFMIWLLIASTTVHKNRSQLFLTIVLSSCTHTHWTIFFVSLLLHFFYGTFYFRHFTFKQTITIAFYVIYDVDIAEYFETHEIIEKLRIEFLWLLNVCTRKKWKNLSKTITKATCNVYFSPYQQFMDDLDVWSLKMS